jgi:hypothetical protein
VVGKNESNGTSLTQLVSPIGSALRSRR